MIITESVAPPAESLHEQDWERLDQVIATNITGLVALTRSRWRTVMRSAPK